MLRHVERFWHAISLANHEYGRINVRAWWWVWRGSTKHERLWIRAASGGASPWLDLDLDFLIHYDHCSNWLPCRHLAIFVIEHGVLLTRSFAFWESLSTQLRSHLYNSFTSIMLETGISPFLNLGKKIAKPRGWSIEISSMGTIKPTDIISVEGRRSDGRSLEEFRPACKSPAYSKVCFLERYILRSRVKVEAAR